MACGQVDTNKLLIDTLDQLDESKLPQELRDKLDLTQIKELLLKGKAIRILITGKTGNGKSTLVNGIIGKNVAEVGNSLRHGVTTEVTEYACTIHGIQVCVWDSPGLQDGTENEEAYLDDMGKKCVSADLNLYCVEMDQSRFVANNPDIIAMTKITKAFGAKFWESALIVLTFANVVEHRHGEWYSLKPVDKKTAFQTEVQRWAERIHEALVDEVGVPKEIADDVLVVPAGHYRLRSLPDREYWLSALWFECLGTIQSLEAQSALIQLNVSRMQWATNVTEEDFSRSLEDQPIVFDHVLCRKKTWMVLLNSAGCAGIGAIVGGAISGVLGFGIGIGVGAPVGLAIGLLAAYAIHKIRKKKKNE